MTRARCRRHALALALALLAVRAGATSCDGDSSLHDAAGCTTIEGNLFVIDQDGSPRHHLASVRGGSINSLTGLTSLTAVVGDVLVIGTELTSFSGLENLVSIGGALVIAGNAALTSLSGLDALTRVGDLVVLDNDNLGDLDGLATLRSVDRVSHAHNGSIYISDNSALTNAGGLCDLIMFESPANEGTWVINGSIFIVVSGIEHADFNYCSLCRMSMQAWVSGWIADPASCGCPSSDINAWDTTSCDDLKEVFKDKDTFDADINGWDGPQPDSNSPIAGSHSESFGVTSASFGRHLHRKFA